MKTGYAFAMARLMGLFVASAVVAAAGLSGCASSGNTNTNDTSANQTADATHTDIANMTGGNANSVAAHAGNEMNAAVNEANNEASNEASNQAVNHAGNASNAASNANAAMNSAANQANVGATNTAGNSSSSNTNTNSHAGNVADPLGAGHEEACPLPPPADTRRLTLTVGQTLPDLEVPDLYDMTKKVKLSSFKGNGRWTVLKFWASWCPICKVMAEEFMHPLYDKLGKGDTRKINLVSVGLAYRDTPDKQIAEAKTKGDEWMHLFDAGDQCKKAFGIVATPSVIVLDPDGKVVTFGRLQNKEADPDAGTPADPWANDLKAFLESSCTLNSGN
ncbi:MAG: TlpA family protein disulfide reductase [Planctomycetota bacterium]